MNLGFFLPGTSLKTHHTQAPFGWCIMGPLVETCILGSWNPLCPEVIKSVDHLVLLTPLASDLTVF